MLAEAVAVDEKIDSDEKVIMAEVSTVYDEVVAIAEAIPAEGKTIDYSNDDMAEIIDDKAVEVKLSELDIHADPEGVKRRALALRDEIFTGKDIELRHDITDPLAVRLRDADHEWTLLHHAAFIGRKRAIASLLNFVSNVYGQRDLLKYMSESDDQGRTPLELSLIAGHTESASFLRHYLDDSPVRQDIAFRFENDLEVKGEAGTTGLDRRSEYK